MGISKWRPIHTPPGRTLAEAVGPTKAKARAEITSVTRGVPERESNLAFLGALFDIHVFEFAGFEDFAALLALHELGILGSADNLYAWGLAVLFDIPALRW